MYPLVLSMIVRSYFLYSLLFFFNNFESSCLEIEMYVIIHEEFVNMIGLGEQYIVPPLYSGYIMLSLCFMLNAC